MLVTTGVVYVLFVSPEMAVPPVATVYHRYCPLVPPDAVSVSAALPHEVLLVVVGAAGKELTVKTATFVDTCAATAPETRHL